MLANFVTQCLSEYFIDVITTMKAIAKRAGIGVTNEAINSLAYETIAHESSFVGSLTFQQALRFVDMGAGRGHPLGGLTTVTQVFKTRKEEGFKQVKDNVRKPKKIYSKIAYGKLTYLENRLLSAYSQEVVKTVKQNIGNGS